MHVRILGSAAGGGFPQWNCGCLNCVSARAGTFPGPHRTQTSVAVSGDDLAWYLLQASPEVRAQLESYRPLHPRAPRDTPLAGIFLTNGDLDACLGLLSLREGQPLTVYATEAVRRSVVEGNAFYRTLERFAGQVTWRLLRIGGSVRLETGLTVDVIAAPGKVPLHSREEPSEEDNVALRFTDAAGSSVLFAPTVARLAPALVEAARDANLVLFDGTFWTADELVAAGLGTRDAASMGHLPLAGADGSLAFLATCPGQVMLLHVNNTNPILREDGTERHALAAHGVAVAYDGMEWKR